MRRDESGGDLTEADAGDRRHQPRRKPRILDLAALVAGYAMAALLVKSFWPEGGLPHRSSAVVLAIAYLWLGLAMGGPLVLAIDRRARPHSDPARPTPRYTWAENGLAHDRRLLDRPGHVHRARPPARKPNSWASSPWSRR